MEEAPASTIITHQLIADCQKSESSSIPVLCWISAKVMFKEIDYVELDSMGLEFCLSCSGPQVQSQHYLPTPQKTEHICSWTIFLTTEKMQHF